MTLVHPETLPEIPVSQQGNGFHQRDEKRVVGELMFRDGDPRGEKQGEVLNGDRRGEESGTLQVVNPRIRRDERLGRLRGRRVLVSQKMKGAMRDARTRQEEVHTLGRPGAGRRLLGWRKRRLTD